MGKKVKINKTIVNAAAWGSVLTLTTSLITGFSVSAAGSNSDLGPGNKTSGDVKVGKNQKASNVIYIILDDIGFSDLGCYGSEIKTPNIDKLAENGLRYNNFNACPMSSATRASLLTGRESNSVGMGQVANVALEEDRPNLQGAVTDKAGMISEILKTEGYSTFGVGKWHVAPTYTITPAGPFDYWPLSKGFDRYYGFMDGETDQYNPQLLCGNEMIDAPNSDGYNLNDDLLKHAEQYITDQVSVYPDKPFFLNYGFGTGHSPQQVPQSYIDMYAGVYDKGWDQIRQERFERQLGSGIIPSGSELHPTDETVKSWDSLSADEKKLFIRFMENYAGYITQADEEVGKLIDHLKKVGVYDNTMIILIGDNGATSDGGPFGTDCFIGGLTSGIYPSVEKLSAKHNEIGGPDMQALYPKGWAQVSNTPFGHYKGSVYTGALRNPLIISWPAGITDAGSIRDQYVHVTDITPTVLDVLGIAAPRVLNGVEQMTMYGTSIAGTFNNRDAAEPRNMAITYVQPNRSIYKDGWRAVSSHKNGTSFDDDVWELYNTKTDYTESINVAAENPQKLEELKKLFMSEAAKYKMLPLTESSTKDMGFIRYDSSANKNTFKYYKGVGHIATSAAPPVNTNSFAISVTATRTSKSDSGVIAAMGDEIGGYTFYIMNNKLVFLYDKFGKISKITSDIDVPVGEVKLKFDFTRTSMVEGTGTLYINDQNVGSGKIATAPTVTIEGFDIGRDMYKAVSTDYKDLGDFAFNGQFNYVQFDITPFVPSQQKN